MSGGGLRKILRLVFKTDRGHFRTVWRFVAFIVAVVLVSLAWYWLRPDYDFGDQVGALDWNQVIGSAEQLSICLIASWLVLWALDRRPVRLLGLDRGRHVGRMILLGLIVGAGLSTLTTLLIFCTGQLSIELGGPLAVLPDAVLRSVLLFSFAGIFEEVLTRGYLLQILAEGTRPWIAMVVMCGLFAAMHLGNPGITVLAVINIFVAGLLLSLAYFKSRGLWFPSALHFAWNWTTGIFWGHEVSGLEPGATIFNCTGLGPDWVSGGNFGIEGSLVMTLVVGIAIFTQIRWSWPGPTWQRRMDWQRYPRGFRLAPLNDDHQPIVDQ